MAKEDGRIRGQDGDNAQNDIAKDNVFVEKNKLKNLEEDIKENIKEADNHAIVISCYVHELNQIVLRPDPFTAMQYVDQTIEAEQREQRSGFEETIVGFKRLVEKCWRRECNYTCLRVKCKI